MLHNGTRMKEVTVHLALLQDSRLSRAQAARVVIVAVLTCADRKDEITFWGEIRKEQEGSSAPYPLPMNK